MICNLQITPTKTYNFAEIVNNQLEIILLFIAQLILHLQGSSLYSLLSACQNQGYEN